MNDFADWLSPIVVKELRQGMRSKVFVGTFTLLQVFMIFCIVTALGEDSQSGAKAFFWSVVGAALLFGMPMRGAFSISGEIKEKTFELLLLTRLSAKRIIFGKWVALFLQSLLLVSSILPYVVLRYFLGGVDLVSELTVLGCLLWASALLTALAVGVSPYMQGVVGRLCFAFGGVVLLYLSLILASGAFFLRGMTGSSHWEKMVILLIFTPLFFLVFLDLGIAKISPIGENHTWRKRLLALNGIVLAGVAAAIFGERIFLAWTLLILIAPVCTVAVLEENVMVPSLYRPALGIGFTRFFGRLFYPGWTTAVPFTVLAAVGIFLISPLRFADPGISSFLFAGIGVLLFPLVMIRVFRREGPIFPLFFGYQVFCFILSIVILAFVSFIGDIAPAMLLPTTGFFTSLWKWNLLKQSGHGAVISFAILIGSLIIYGLISAREWRNIFQMERKAVEPN